jgi:hypothetical protein
MDGTPVQLLTGQLAVFPASPASMTRVYRSAAGTLKPNRRLTVVVEHPGGCQDVQDWLSSQGNPVELGYQAGLDRGARGVLDGEQDADGLAGRAGACLAPSVGAVMVTGGFLQPGG